MTAHLTSACIFGVMSKLFFVGIGAVIRSVCLPFDFLVLAGASGVMVGFCRHTLRPCHQIAFKASK